MGRSALDIETRNNDRVIVDDFDLAKRLWKRDAPFARENGELSLLTFMIYLNGGYKGGATRFESLAVQGQPGTALVFEHGLIHEGGEVTEGVKYVLRSDVMYGRIGQLAG